MTAELQRVASWSGWNPLDRQLANTLLREIGNDSVVLWLSVALLTWVSREGDVCIDLEQWAGRRLADVIEAVSRESDVTALTGLQLPGLEQWRELLAGSGLLSSAETAGPLVLRGQSLYLERFHQHELVLAARVGERMQAACFGRQSGEWVELLDRWFPATGVQARRAAMVAVTRRWCVVTGGPGTGKTSIVVRLLGLLTDLAARNASRAPRVLLLAPTGKAAARLSESIVQAKARFAQLSSTMATLPTEARTVHSALAACRRLPDGSRRPLAADVVVLDEASMIDLAMMRRLLDAAVHVERFIALGDPHQLASVEAGAVLGELCAAARADGATPTDAGTPPRLGAYGRIAEHVVELTESHRFRDDSGIGLLAKCIKQGDVVGTFRVLEARDPAVEFLECDPRGFEQVEELLVRGNAALRSAANPADALVQLDRFRVLCAHRKGRFGVETWNERLAYRFRQQQYATHQRFQAEPILIAENAADASLHNGDLGIIWREPGEVRAWFRSSDGQCAAMGVSRLPRYEPAYVMSVHKSQGSEVDTVVIILPEADSPLLTRELLYTAVTRARKRCTLIGTRDAVARAVTRKVDRHSGLAAALIANAPRELGDGGPHEP